MQEWLTIVIGSVVVGLLCAWKFQGRYGLFLAGAIPWFSLLAWLLYHEYFMPYAGGGASMWPVAQLWAGSIAAAVGCSTYLLCHRAFRNLI